MEKADTDPGTCSRVPKEECCTGYCHFRQGLGLTLPVTLPAHHTESSSALVQELNNRLLKDPYIRGGGDI